MVLIAAGQRVTADQLNTLDPLAVVKQADESVTSSTSLQNDNELFITVDESSTYMMTCYLDYEGGTQGSSDMSIGWSVPTGATLRWAWAFGVNASGGTGSGNSFIESSTITAGTNGSGTLMGMVLVGSLVVGGTAGNLQLKWAQHQSSTTATTVHAQSFLALQQVD